MGMAEVGRAVNPIAVPFAHSLAQRILKTLELALGPAAILVASGAACTNGDDPSVSAASGAVRPLPPAKPVELCFQWPVPPAAASSAAPHRPEGDAAPPCPTRSEARNYLPSQDCGKADEVLSDATPGAGTCCYQVRREYCAVMGRPFFVAGQARVSGPVPDLGSEWLLDGAAIRPAFFGLTPDERTLLAEAWTRDAVLEHASVASFGRFAFELLAVAAPARLVAAAHQAALDEVRHASLCFGLASAYAAVPVCPGPFPFDGVVAVSSGLAEVAVRTAREGCVGETLAALLAAEQYALAADPAVRAVLLVIAEDEARHAELAWATVGWAIHTGGHDVRSAVADALSHAIHEVCDPAYEQPSLSPSLVAHGRIDGATRNRVIDRASAEILRPCARMIRAAPIQTGAGDSRAAKNEYALTRNVPQDRG